MQREKKVRDPFIILGLSLWVLMLFGCGQQAGGEDPFEEGKAEMDFALSLSPGQPDTFSLEKMHANWLYAFYLAVPAGQHAYSLTMKEQNLGSRALQVAWLDIGREYTREHYEQLKAKLQACYALRPDSGCSFFGADLQTQYMGTFEGPTMVVLFVQDLKYPSLKLEMLLKEQPALSAGQRGTLLLGWSDRRDPYAGLVMPYHPEVTTVPFEGDQLQLSSLAPLFDQNDYDLWRGEGFLGFVQPRSPLLVDSCDNRPLELCYDPQTSEPLAQCELYQANYCQVQIQGQ